ncbi:MAG: hypothetical protein LBS44_05565, partial [Deltaproteobacteria bacterium]|nr:hypothetical protein [Deltaproteobacteria bacterium]
NPTITSNVVTYDVIIDVNNPELKLLPGMTAYVDIELYREADVLLVPNTALNYRPTEAKAPSQAQASSAVQPTAPSAQAEPAAEQASRAAGHWGGTRTGEGRASQETDNKARSVQAEETHGRVYVLGADRQPKMVNLALGTTDLRQTVVKGGELKEGDMVIIGELQPEADRTLLTGSGSGGGPRPRF